MCFSTFAIIIARTVPVSVWRIERALVTAYIFMIHSPIKYRSSQFHRTAAGEVTSAWISHGTQWQNGRKPRTEVR